mgnify:CR=1 FL=1
MIRIAYTPQADTRLPVLALPVLRFRSLFRFHALPEYICTQYQLVFRYNENGNWISKVV